MATLDVLQARSNFPALKSGYIFADNAGGSQVTKDVADRVADYLLNTNVQLGADYSWSVESSRRVLKEGPAVAVQLFNAASPDEIVLGSSSTQNLENLARGLVRFACSVLMDVGFMLTYFDCRRKILLLETNSLSPKNMKVCKLERAGCSVNHLYF